MPATSESVGPDIELHLASLAKATLQRRQDLRTTASGARFRVVVAEVLAVARSNAAVARARLGKAVTFRSEYG